MIAWASTSHGNHVNCEPRSLALSKTCHPQLVIKCKVQCGSYSGFVEYSLGYNPQLILGMGSEMV